MALNVFRGLAAVLMILSHWGVGGVGAQVAHTPLTAALVEMGSWAPVLFFFATGWGMGLSGTTKPLTHGVAQKVLLLLAADAFLNWAGGRRFGLDFFGFIGLSMAAVAVVRASQDPLRWALIGLAAVVLARFGLAALPHSDWPALLRWLTGVAAVDGISYPLAPWLAYPLLGFALSFAAARCAQGQLDAAPGWRLRLGQAVVQARGLGWLALVLLGASFALQARGAPIFRWGSVSFAFFVQGLGALALAGWVAPHLARRPGMAGALALRGPASLLVVPLHYALLRGLEHLMAPPSALIWALIAVLIAALVLPASRHLAALMDKPFGGRLRWWALWAALAAGAWAMAAHSPWLWSISMAGQLLVAWCLAARGRERSQWNLSP